MFDICLINVLYMFDVCLMYDRLTFDACLVHDYYYYYLRFLTTTTAPWGAFRAVGLNSKSPTEWEIGKVESKHWVYPYEYSSPALGNSKLENCSTDTHDYMCVNRNEGEGRADEEVNR